MRDLLNRLDVLNESPKSDFKQMFSAIEKAEGTTDVMAYARNQFNWAKSTFQTNDKPNSEQILWWMRYVRLYILYQLSTTFGEKEAEVWKPVFDKEMSKMSKNTGKGPGVMLDDARRVAGQQATQNAFEHFKSLNLENIDTMVFGWQTPLDIIDKMEAIEEKWKENQRFNIDHDDYERSGDRHFGKPEKLIDFGDGFAWWDLARPSCSIEGNAMGHCGNSPRSYSDDTVLSLRKEVKQKGKTYYQPYLTFILQSDGSLSEMKGRFNEKPQAEFHPYIIELLKHDAIQSIEGGGYLPQNNFDISDLDDEEIEELYSKKPGLKNPMHAVLEKLRTDPKSITQGDVEIVHDKLAAEGLDPYEMTLRDDGYITLKTFGDLEVYANDKLGWKHPIHDIIKLINDPEKIREFTDFDAESLPDEYFVEMIRRLPNYYQDKIFAETGTEDPERAFWKLQRERHRFWEYMIEAFDAAFTIDLSDTDFGDEDDDLETVLKERAVEYAEYTSLNSWQVSVNFDGYDGEVEMYTNLGHLIDAWEAARDEYGEGFEGDIWAVREHGWGYEDENHEYSEQFGRHASHREPLLDENDQDLLIKELMDSTGKVKMATALDKFEKRFDMKESKDSADNLLADIIRLARI